MRRVATKEHQCRETVDIVKSNLKIYVIILAFFKCGVCTDNIVFFYITVNKSSYIIILNYPVI